jgi:eukaryotic-like serine/threonine-protein kinase
MGKPSEAMASFDEALAIHRKLVTANPSTSSYRSNLAGTLRRCGIAMQKCNRRAEAESAFRQSIAVLRELPKPSPSDHYNIACYQSLLAGVVAAGSGEADNAMESLRRAVAAGWRDLTLMRKDSDLDSIRSRPDFQLLMLDLAMPADPLARPN